jgi:hypothetical protein
MTPHTRAYILRIAASLESGDGPRCAQNLVQQLLHDDPTLDEPAIASAVAYVRASLLRIPFTTIRMEIAA